MKEFHECQALFFENSNYSEEFGYVLVLLDQQITSALGGVMQLIVLSLLASFSFVSAAHDQSEFCTAPRSEMDVAEIVAESCDLNGVSESTLAQEIRIEDDADGPGYKDLYFYFRGEQVATQLIFDKGNCWVEKNFDFTCPNSHKLANRCDHFDSEFAWGWENIQQKYSCEGTTEGQGTACVVQAQRNDEPTSFNIYFRSADELGGGIMFNDNKEFTPGEVLNLVEIENNTWMDQFSYKTEATFKEALGGGFELEASSFQRPTGPFSGFRAWDFLWSSTYTCTAVE